jgi:hypothetical protein
LCKNFDYSFSGYLLAKCPVVHRLMGGRLVSALVPLNTAAISIVPYYSIILPTPTRLTLMMDVATFAAKPESYDRLSRAQISIFFSSNTSATREQCDKLAAELLEGPVSATSIQGGTSYTVQRHQVRKVVQFRASKLDMIHLRLIQQVYNKFVPRCLYHGLLGSLPVYIWDWVSGPAFLGAARDVYLSPNSSIPASASIRALHMFR